MYELRRIMRTGLFLPSNEVNNPYIKMRPSLPWTERPCTVRKLICWSLFEQPRNARGRPSTQGLPMVLLASQELAARAATHDRHLRRGAQLAVAKTAS